MATNDKPIANDKKNTNPPPKGQVIKQQPMQANKPKENKPVLKEVDIQETIASFDETLNTLFGNELFNTEIGVDINDPEFDAKAAKTKKNVPIPPIKPVEPVKEVHIDKQQFNVKNMPSQQARDQLLKEQIKQVGPEQATILKQTAKEIKDLTDLNNNLNNNLK